MLLDSYLPAIYGIFYIGYVNIRFTQPTYSPNSFFGFHCMTRQFNRIDSFIDRLVPNNPRTHRRLLLQEEFIFRFLKLGIVMRAWLKRWEYRESKYC